jgi:hypothetical protein
MDNWLEAVARHLALLSGAEISSSRRAPPDSRQVATPYPTQGVGC